MTDQALAIHHSCLFYRVFVAVLVTNQRLSKVECTTPATFHFSSGTNAMQWLPCFPRQRLQERTKCSNPGSQTPSGRRLSTASGAFSFAASSPLSAVCRSATWKAFCLMAIAAFLGFADHGASTMARRPQARRESVASLQHHT